MKYLALSFIVLLFVGSNLFSDVNGLIRASPYNTKENVQRLIYVADNSLINDACLLNFVNSDKRFVSVTASGGYIKEITVSELPTRSLLRFTFKFEIDGMTRNWLQTFVDCRVHLPR